MNSRADNQLVEFIYWIWHKTSVPVFLERFILPLFAAGVVLLAATNPMGFDTTQRVTGTVTLIFAAYFAAHTVYKITKPSPPKSSESKPVEPESPEPTKGSQPLKQEAPPPQRSKRKPSTPLNAKKLETPSSAESNPDPSSYPLVHILQGQDIHFNKSPITTAPNQTAVEAGKVDGMFFKDSPIQSVAPKAEGSNVFSMSDGQRFFIKQRLGELAGNSVRLIQTGSSTESNVIYAQLSVFEKWNVQQGQVDLASVAGESFPSVSYITGPDMSAMILRQVYSVFDDAGVNFRLTPDAYMGPNSLGTPPPVVIVIR